MLLQGILVLSLQRVDALAMRGIHARDVEAGEVLQHLPVLAPFLDQIDDGRRNAEADETLLGIDRIDERRLALPRTFRQVDELGDGHQVGGVGGKLPELLLEADFADSEVRRCQLNVHQFEFAVLVEVLQACRRPGLVEIRVAVEREPFVQRLALARIMHEHRVHAALHRQTRLPRRNVVGDAVLALAWGIDVEHRRRVVVREELHGVLQVVPLQRRRCRADEDVRMEGGDQAEFLARFLLAAVRPAMPCQIGILPGKA